MGLLAIVNRPSARSIIRVNSTNVCEMENNRPLLAPVLVPWVIVAKNKGPGARAPETVTKMIMATKLSISIAVILVSY